MSLHGISTILADKRILSAITLSEVASLSLKDLSPLSVSTNSTVTVRFEGLALDFRENRGKVLAMAAADATTSLLSQTT